MYTVNSGAEWLEGAELLALGLTAGYALAVFTFLVVFNYIRRTLAGIVRARAAYMRASPPEDESTDASNLYEVVVGNVGLAYSGPEYMLAVQMYDNYRWRSREGVGRVAGQPVALLRDGEIIREHRPGASNA